jgi:hypothetical protein
MVAARYGSADPDVKYKGTKEKSDKYKAMAGVRTPYSGLMGDESNTPLGPPNDKKAGSRNGKPSRGGGGGGVSVHLETPAAYRPGGFRNKAMEHKR